MRLLALLLMACLILGFGCSSHNESTSDLMLDETDFDKSFPLRVGQTVDLALNENASTGYSWHYSWQPQAALELTSNYSVPNRPQLEGSGGVHHLVLRALQPQTVVITVQYGRWWEGGERDEPHTLTLTVSP